MVLRSVEQGVLLFAPVGIGGCAVKINPPQGAAMKRVCVDGPVFDARTVVWS